jgi:UDP-glucose 4-epimerase
MIYVTRVVLIGALGTVGVWTAERFQQDGHEVIAADIRDDFSLRPSLKDSVPFRQVDLLNVDALTSMFRQERPDGICLVAAKTTGVPGINGDPDPFGSFQVNGMGPVCVFEAARRAGVGRVAFASTKGVYAPFDGDFGAPTYQPVTEDYPRRSRPTSRPYGAAKIMAEEAGQYYQDRYGMEFRALRFGNIIRPGKQGTGGGGAAAFPAMVSAALRGEPYRMQALAAVRDDFVYVKDVAQGLVRASTVDNVPSWVFNIGTGVPSTMADFGQAVRDAIPGADIEVELTPGEDEYKVRCVLDISRARAELGYEPEFDLPTAVADLVKEMSGSPSH